MKISVSAVPSQPGTMPAPHTSLKLQGGCRARPATSGGSASTTPSTPASCAFPSQMPTARWSRSGCPGQLLTSFPSASQGLLQPHMQPYMHGAQGQQWMSRSASQQLPISFPGAAAASPAASHAWGTRTAVDVQVSFPTASYQLPGAAAASPAASHAWRRDRADSPGPDLTPGAMPKVLLSGHGVRQILCRRPLTLCQSGIFFGLMQSFFLHPKQVGGCCGHCPSVYSAACIAPSSIRHRLEARFFAPLCSLSGCMFWQDAPMARPRAPIIAAHTRPHRDVAGTEMMPDR